MQPPQKPKDELAEVERALSVLKGRHPEHERVAREQNAAAAERQKSREAEARVEDRARMRRRLVQVVIGVAVLAVLAVAGTLFHREVARRGRIEQSSDAYRAMGFVVVDTTSRSTPGKLTGTLEDACYTVASTDNVPLKLKVGARAFEGPAPVVFCTCQADSLDVSGDVAPGGGLTLLKIASDRLGGSLAFAYLPFVPKTMSKETDLACNERALDAWLAAKHAPPLDAGDTKNAPLASSGARFLGKLPASKPFATFESPDSACLVAFGNATDKLSIRQPGGNLLVANAPGSFVWCAAKGYAATIHREGTGDVFLATIPGAAAGGLLGVREVIAQEHLSVGFTGMPATDHAWNARQVLLASSVPEQLITTAGVEVPPEPDARLAAISFGTANALVPEVGTDVFSFCQPLLGDRPGESLCIFSGPQTWRPGGPSAVGGIARAKLPFWLFGLKDANDPVAMKVATTLAGLARRLKHEGFEPTTLEAVTETNTGIEVLGRSKEDAIVAVGLSPTSPFVYPYAPDGVAWTLDSKPRIVPLVPPNSITMTTSVKPLPPKNKRSTVVFRRQTR